MTEKPPLALLLHACCAPCCSSVLERVSRDYRVTVFYYNPNISPEEEYRKRCMELERFVRAFPTENPVSLIFGDYETERFHKLSRGKEDLPEGGARCRDCFSLRLFETARLAKERGFDLFTTTLSVSPLKNAALLNEIGLLAEKEYGVSYLVSDFKKKDGYKRSIELSKEYGLYRQDYCGCIFSKQERERKKKEKQ